MDVYALAAQSVDASIAFGYITTAVTAVIAVALTVGIYACRRAARGESYSDWESVGVLLGIALAAALVVSLVSAMATVNTSMQRDWAIQQRVLDADPDFNLRNR